jgi:hypothetical protein
MRRVLLAVASLSLLGAGLFHPAIAAPETGATDAVTAGTAKIVVGNDLSGFPTWTITLNGQIAAGGRFFSGTARGTESEDFPFVYEFPLSGTSPSGSITARCWGYDQPDSRQLLGPIGPNAGPPAPPAGLLDMNCDVSIDGAASVPLHLVIALAPTGTNTYAGAYAAVPDNVRPEALPTVPAVSFGTSSVSVFGGADSGSITYVLTGQITLGDQTFHGTAIGEETTSDSFTLSGTSPTGSLTATCTAQLVDTGELVPPNGGVALSVLSCDGSVNGGAPGHATLVSVYRMTSHVVHAGDYSAYDGAFVGL